jgi:predicted amidophosphoribosyltransferase
MKKKVCPDCKKEFEFNPSGRFVRKYCTKCGKKRKKAWDNQWKIKFEDLPDD